MEKNFFTNDANAIVTSDRIFYTPSHFARSTLLHLQEIGTLVVNKAHVSERNNLRSYLFFMVTDGAGKLVFDEKEYMLKGGDCVFIDCCKHYSHETYSDSLWRLLWIHFFGINMSGIYEKYLERGGEASVSSKRNGSFYCSLEFSFFYSINYRLYS